MTNLSPTAFKHKTPDAWKRACRREKRDRIAQGLFVAFFIVGLIILGLGLVRDALDKAHIDVVWACQIGADC